MQRVAEREDHLTSLQVREEVAAGRMEIPANRMHLGYQLDPMAIGRATKTKINANMGARLSHPVRMKKWRSYGGLRSGARIQSWIFPPMGSGCLSRGNYPK